MTRDVLLVSDDRMVAHAPGPGHPESPERLSAILERLRTRPVAGTRWQEARPAAREAVERIHAVDHVSLVESLRGRRGALDPDTRVSPASVEAAWLAAGAAVQATEAVVRGDADRAFALVRPPGHHARGDEAMGFCLFNNIAIAAEHARRALGVERVLVADWDLHHGNGTQETFERRDDVLFFSSHRWPFYPGTGALEETGEDAGAGFTVNVPLPAGAGDGELASVWRELLGPIAEAFQPQLVLVSAGFDPHRDDPIGDLEVTEDGFAELCGIADEIARRHANGRLVLVLEGGYDVDGLARSVEACTRVLAGETPPPGSKRRSDVALQQAQAAHRRHWRLG